MCNVVAKASVERKYGASTSPSEEEQVSFLLGFLQERIEKSDLAPSSWNLYFESSEDVTISGTKDTFRVYRSGPKDATAFILLHGAGHTALSWALTTVITFQYIC